MKTTLLNKLNSKRPFTEILSESYSDFTNDELNEEFSELLETISSNKYADIKPYLARLGAVHHLLNVRHEILLTFWMNLIR